MQENARVIMYAARTDNMADWNVTDGQLAPMDPGLARLLQNFMIAMLFFAKYSWMLTGIIGIPGNVITILVSLQKENRRISTCIYMVAVAAGDTLMLIEVIWAHSLIFWWQGEGRPSELALQFAWYQGSTSSMFSSYSLAQMSIDRLIVVRFPLSAQRLCTKSRANKTVVITFTLCCLFNIQMFFLYGYTREEDQLLHASIPGNLLLETIILAIHFAISTVLPFCIIVVCNFWIIVAINRASRKRDEMSAGNAASREKDERYLTRMLIVVCVAYVIATTPYRMYGIVMGFPAIQEVYDLSVPYWKIRYDLQYLILLFIFGNNHSVNFYLYVIGGGKKYRQDIKRFFQRFGSWMRRKQ